MDKMIKEKRLSAACSFLVFIALLLVFIPNSGKETYRLLLPRSLPAAGNILPAPLEEKSLCGNGSQAENYGFDYDLLQPHWTVGWEGYVSEDAVEQVDRILDELTDANIAETMILILPADQVGSRVNCAVHFLRYMKLGKPSGERKDNGFVFLIVVEDGKIDVHYGVGMGLPALTAHDLTDLNRLAENTYAETGSLDKALLELVRGYDAYARSKYPPLMIPTPTGESPFTITTTGTRLSTTAVCCLLCLVALIILLIILFSLGGGRRRSYNRPVISMRPTSWGSSSSSWSRPSGSGGWSPPRMRGGSGSGRSGRGN